MFTKVVDSAREPRPTMAGPSFWSEVAAIFIVTPTRPKNGGNVYHGGSSLSFFIDIGGDEDIYPSRPNNQIQAGGEHSIFIDLPGAIEGARSEQAVEDLLKP